MEFVYVVAAFAIVPALLLVFDRLSRPPEQRARRVRHAPAAQEHPESVADEAERWLQGHS